MIRINSTYETDLLNTDHRSRRTGKEKKEYILIGVNGISGVTRM